MATTQVQRRLSGSKVAAVAAGLAIGLAAVAARAENWMPLLPDQDFYDFQLFAPPNLQEYAIRPSPREGIFFSYERLYWSITPPPVVNTGNRDFYPTEVLSPDVIANLNNTQPQGQVPPFIVYGTPEATIDLNTSWLMSQMTWGNRYDVGWIYDDVGFSVRYFNVQPQTQSFVTINEFAVNTPTTTANVDITPPADFLSPGFVTVTVTNDSPAPDHIISQRFTQRNSSEVQSVGVASLLRRSFYRTNPVTLSLAGRFVQFADRYSINYESDEYPFPDVVERVDPVPLQRGGWDTRTFNNMVGPEFGLAFERSAGRWTWGLDLRFTPAMNFQNNLYRGANFPSFLSADYIRSQIESQQVQVIPGDIGGTVVSANNLPLLYQIYGTRQQNATNAAEHNVVFSPIGEWTLETRYRVSQGVLLRLGYTGSWMAGIARATTNTGFISKPEQVRIVQLQDPTRPPQTNSAAADYNPWVARDITIDYTSLRPQAGNDNSYVFMNGVNMGLEFSY